MVRDCLTFLISLLEEAIFHRNLWGKGNTTEAIRYLTTVVSRDEANKLLNQCSVRKTIFPSNTWEEYEKRREEELFHIKHVRRCVDNLWGHTSNQHDHSKDELYLLVTICGFEKSWEKYVSKTVLECNLKWHHEQESHHPEYERIRGHKILERDIVEMVIDRLSRNLQFNRGKYNKEEWVKYEPKFLKDHQSRLNAYKMYRENLAPLVQNTWNVMRNEKLLVST